MEGASTLRRDDLLAAARDQQKPLRAGSPHAFHNHLPAHLLTKTQQTELAIVSTLIGATYFSIYNIEECGFSTRAN